MIDLLKLYLDLLTKRKYTSFSFFFFLVWLLGKWKSLVNLCYDSHCISVGQCSFMFLRKEENENRNLDSGSSQFSRIAMSQKDLEFY